MNAFKVKVSQYHAMIGTGVKIIDVPIHNFSDKLGWVVNATFQPPYSQWQRSCTYCTGGWVDLGAGLI